MLLALPAVLRTLTDGQPRENAFVERCGALVMRGKQCAFWGVSVSALIWVDSSCGSSRLRFSPICRQRDARHKRFSAHEEVTSGVGRQETITLMSTAEFCRTLRFFRALGRRGCG